MSITVLRFLAIVTLTVGLYGCKSTAVKTGASAAPSPRLAKASQLYDKGSYTEALLECVDLNREDPDMPGLFDLKQRVLEKLEAQRKAQAAARAATSQERMQTDVQQAKEVPDTYKLRRTTTNQVAGLVTPPSAIQKALQQKVDIHLTDASLQLFIDTMYANWKLPIVADSALAETKTFKIDADRASIREVLDYVGRNLGITFYAGQDLIWATKRDEAEPTAPMETRLYRLKKGDPTIKVSKIGKATSESELPEAEEYARLAAISNAINRFVPAVEGSDFMFDENTHVIIVRNTIENLRRIEEILEAMDVTPPQVLIEARFVSTKVQDMSELGIDWLLNSAYPITKKGIKWDGKSFNASETEIASGAAIGYQTFENMGQGLNLTYQGVLTDPLYRAVLHALDKAGKSRVLSVPRVTTVNNQEAQIHVGEKYLYYRQFTSENVVVGYDANGREIRTSATVPYGDPYEEPLGIILVVTPSLGADQRTITLALSPSRTELVDWNIYSGVSGFVNATSSVTNATSGVVAMIKLPIFRESVVRTKLVVNSGETVILGGLVSANEKEEIAGVPFLSSIPLLGRLFSYRTTAENKENLLIFVTATVISESGEDLVPVAPGQPGTPRG